MKTWVIIITFLISLTGLLFKTTEDGKGPGPFKRPNRPGIFLLLCMVVALIVNFVTAKEEKKKADQALNEQSKKDSAENFKKEVRWKFDSLGNKAIIDSFKKASIQSEKLSELQFENIRIQKQANDLLKEKLNSAQQDLSSLRFPIDTLLLSCSVKLKLNHDIFIDKLYNNPSNHPYPSSFIMNDLFEDDSSFYHEISPKRICIEFRVGQKKLEYHFDLSNVINGGIPEFDLDPNYSRRRNNSSYQLISYNPNEVDTLNFTINRIKCIEINNQNFDNLTDIFKSRCYLRIYGGASFSLSCFIIKVDDILLTDDKSQRKVHFVNFKPIQEKFDFYDAFHYCIVDRASYVSNICNGFSIE